MKIPLFIAAFLLLALPAWPQSYSIAKGNVCGLSIVGNAIETRHTQTLASENFKLNHAYSLTEEWELSLLDAESRSHLYFSNQMHVWLGGQTTLWVDNFEQFVDKDEQGKLLPDGGSFLGTFRLSGVADFQLERISDSGFFSLETPAADLIIKATSFYVEAISTLTAVECYTGTIILTNSTTFKDTILHEGYGALIYGVDGNKNSVVKIFPLEDFHRTRHQRRLAEFSAQ